MSNENRSYTRTSNNHKVQIKNPGPYEAIVVNHLDKQFMGTLEVELLKYTESGNIPERSGQIIQVKYLSPFYGVTSNKGLQKVDDYAHTQKSYGMWFIPPDIGTKVLVIFAEGNADMGYWIGCIQDDFMNFMVPDGRACTTVTTDSTPENLKKMKLPVGEYNKELEDGLKIDPTYFKKPYNKDFTCILENQGLLEDETRGTTTSSARREVPSMVFGFSTPGPLDKRAGSPRVELGATHKKANYAYNRLGGSSFVLDDGNERYVRKTHAAEGPPFYYNRDAEELEGDETIPHNELVRLRTRTGHQILLHNSEDLIYISNSRGTAWIELTSDGKIDIYAEDSISVMSNNDINLTAERDFNVEAGRNINMKATARWSDEQQYLDNKESGRIHLESVFNTNLYVGKDYRLTVKGTSDTHVGLTKMTTVEKDYHLHSKQSIFQKSEMSTHEEAKKSWFRKAEQDINDIAGLSFQTKCSNQHIFVSNDTKSRIGRNYHMEIVKDMFTVIEQGNQHLQIEIGEQRVFVKDKISIDTDASQHYRANEGINLIDDTIIAGDAAVIHWNSGLSTWGNDSERAKTPKVATIPTPPTDALVIEPLPTINLPYVIPGANKPIIYDSILARAPQHEPWMHHENLNPHAFKKEDTDREDPGMIPTAEIYISPDIFMKGNSTVKSTQVALKTSRGKNNYTGSTGDGLHETGDLGSESGNTDVNSDEEGILVPVKTSSGLTAMVAEMFKDNFQGFIDDLEATGYKIKKLAGYSKRKTASGSGSWSVHASGGAIDINWPDQVMGGVPNGFFMPRPANAPITDMPENTQELAKKHGLGWGGAWRSSDDAMHFSAHKAEGGAWNFPRNGKIPIGPSNINNKSVPPKPEQAGPDLADRPPGETLPGPQNADDTPRIELVREPEGGFPEPDEA